MFFLLSLSVLNASIAFAEHVPIVHIARKLPMEQMKVKPLLHHMLGNGHFEAYSKAIEHFVVASAC
jgi:pyruvate decarboxylase